MNTRLQVEHPVTELVTGTDLVVEQLRVAQGERLSWTQEQLSQRGHAIECRIYAEDPAAGFVPSPGPLHVYRPPSGPGIRLDDGFVEGDVIPQHYDSMIAKLSIWAPTRDHAIQRAIAALGAFEIGGIRHNLEHLMQVLGCEAFRVGPYDTGVVKTLPPLAGEPDHDELAAVLAALLTHRQHHNGQTAETAAQAEGAWALHARTAGLRGR
jgi:acetyl/propionyl-CoA carboxylase alpha subunit